MCFTGAKPTSEMLECRNNLYCSVRKYKHIKRNCSICMECSPHSLTTCECVLRFVIPDTNRQPNVLNRTRIMCIKIYREERRSRREKKRIECGDFSTYIAYFGMRKRLLLFVRGFVLYFAANGS